MAAITRLGDAGVVTPDPEADQADGEPTATAPRIRAASLGAVLGTACALYGFLVGSRPLRDNSFMTHLATGRIIWDTHHVPTTDPYSFTAHGAPWVVQSWLASVLYRGAELLGGLAGVRLLNGLLAAALGALAWTLTRKGQSLIGRVGIVFLALGVGSGMWLERPLLFGLALLGVLLLAAEDRVDPRWLVPAMWVWVNTHGSFPLAFVALAVLGLGRWLDAGRREWPRPELRAGLWAGAGVLVAAVNPLGPRLLAFPLTLLSKTQSFQVVVEWQPPTFGSLAEKVFLVQILVAILLVARRPSWRAALPLVVFGGLALLSARNIPVASLVLLPGMADGVRGLGTVDGERRAPAFTAAVAALVALGLLVGTSSLQGPDERLALYPTSSVRWLDDHGLLTTRSRIVSRDYVGNYLEAAYGPHRARVFFDDRVDMYPTSLVQDYVVLLHGEPGWDRILRSYHPDAVLWDRESPLAQLLEASPRWKVVHRDADWVVAVPA